MKKKLAVFIALIFLVIGGSIGWLAANWKMPQLTVQKISIAFPSEGTAQIIAKMEIQNLGKIPISYFKADYIVKSKEQQIIQGEINLEGKVEANQKGNLELPLFFSIDEIMKLRQEDKIHLNIMGNLYLDLKIIKAKVPFTIQREIQRQESGMNCKVVSLEIHQNNDKMEVVSCLQIQAAFLKKVNNLQATYKLELAGNSIAEGNAYLKKTESQNPTSTMLSIDVDTNLLRKIKEEHTGKTVTVSLTGNLELMLEGQKQRFPFSLNKDILLQGRPFAVEVKGIRFTNISPGRVSLVLDLGVTSKFAKEIADLRSHYKIYASQKQIMEGDLQLPKLEAFGTKKAELPLTIDIATLKKIKAANIDKKTPISIEGNVSARVNEKYMEIPFSITKEIVLKEKPFLLKVNKIRIQKFRLKGSTYAITVAVTNQTDFSIKDLSIEGEIVISDKVTAKVTDKNLTFLPNQTALLHLEMTGKRTGILQLLGKLALQKLTKTNTQWQVQGKTEEGINITTESTQEETVAIEENNE